MSAIAALRALAAGRPLPDSILGACRLESGNIDAFGSEAIGDAFRRVPLAEVSLAEGAECATAALLLTHDEALFADIYDGRIGRLWRIGQRGQEPGEPAVAVAFDTDLHQMRTAVFARAADHPALAADALARVEAAGTALTADDSFPAFRTRAFAIRAFGDAASGAALFAIQTLGPEPVRAPSLTHAVVHWRGDDMRIVRDAVAARDLQTSIAACAPRMGLVA